MGCKKEETCKTVTIGVAMINEIDNPPNVMGEMKIDEDSAAFKIKNVENLKIIKDKLSR